MPVARPASPCALTEQAVLSTKLCNLLFRQLFKPRHEIQQFPRVVRFRGLEQCTRFLHLNQLALPHHADAVAHLAHHWQIMLDKQHRQAQMLLQILKNVQNLRLNGHIKR